MPKTPTTSPDEDLRVALVEISKIKFNAADTDRILEDEKALEQLTVTIRARGVLQPVGLAALPGQAQCYRVVWGRRRIEAAKRAGLTEVPARIKTYTTEEELVETREIENLHRADLNPIEESEAVAHLLDLAMQSIAKTDGPKMRGDHEHVLDPDRYELETRAFHQVAERLGKPIGWVRDRAFLAKLEGRGREHVLAGRLPLSHAREISKVADPETREELAEMAAAGDDNEAPMELRELRRRVARTLYSLSAAPWKLDVPFGDFPACTTCPHNSGNRPGLFDHHERFAKTQQEGKTTGRWTEVSGTKEPDTGVCTNRACFDRKAAAARRAISAAGRKVAKATAEAGNKAPTSKVAEGLVPEHVETKAVLTVARQQIERKAEKGETGKKVKSSASRYEPPPQTGPNRRAFEAWEKTNGALGDQARAAVRELIAGDPAAVVGVVAAQLLSEQPDGGSYWCYNEPGASKTVGDIRQQEKAAQSSAMAAFVATLVGGNTPEACGAIALAAAVPGKTKAGGRRAGRRGASRWEGELYADGPDLCPPMAVRVLAALGREAAYRSIDSFLDAELEKTKADGKKPTSRTAGKKAAKKKAGSKKAARRKAS